jgi:hypothetical protein
MPIIPLSLPFHNIIYYYYSSIEQHVEFVASTYFLSLAIFKQRLCQSHFGLAILDFKSILRQKKNYGNSKIFHHTKTNIIFRKNPLKETKNPSRYHNSIITNLKFQHKAKKLSSFKNPHIKIDPYLLLPRDQNPLSYYYTLQ